MVGSQCVNVAENSICVILWEIRLLVSYLHIWNNYSVLLIRRLGCSFLVRVSGRE